MTPQTRMLAASIGKTFVAATVLALGREGRLGPADRLAQHLGDRPWFAGLPNAESITIDHLLHHSSGLPDHPHLPEFQAAAAARIAAGGAAFTPEEVLGFIAGREPLFEAGTGWAYSDTGYILLGRATGALKAAGYSPAGFSPAGFSPAGFSPAGPRPADSVAHGRRQPRRLCRGRSSGGAAAEPVGASRARLPDDRRAGRARQ